jgi:hypothetical protein
LTLLDAPAHADQTCRNLKDCGYIEAASFQGFRVEKFFSLMREIVGAASDSREKRVKQEGNRANRESKERKTNLSKRKMFTKMRTAADTARATPEA